jgi:hypothetical protein
MTLPYLARKAASLAVVGAALAGSLAGCERFHAANSLEGVSPAQQASCRARMEQTYDAQNRAEIYHSDTYATGAASTPFSSTSTATAASDTLGQRYAFQQMLSNCYNSSPDPVPISNPKP